MTNVQRVLLKHGKIKQADIDKQELKQAEKLAKVDAVKADKTDKTKLTKAELIAKMAELEAFIKDL